MRRRYAEYRPLPRWRRRWRRTRLLHTVQLNLIGRLAVAALCLAGAGAGYVACRLAGLPPALGLAAGFAAVLAVLVVVDRRRLARLNGRGTAGP